MTSFIIQKQVVRVEKLVGERNKFRQVAYKKKIALDERKRFEEKEKRIEHRQDETEKQVSNKIPVARLGILDVVKNFIFKTLLGAFVIKLLPHLPKLKGVLQFGLQATDFLVSFSGSILNAMVTFVDKVYKIVDFGKQQAKLLGGDKGLQNYNKALDMANKVMNSMFIAAMLFSDLSESDADYSAGQQAVDTVKDRVTQQAAQRAAQQAAVNSAARISAASAAGIIAGVGLLSSALGEGAFQLRKFTTKIQKDADIAYSEAQNDKNPFMRFIKSSFYGAFVRPGMMFTNFLLNGLGTLLDVVGAPFRYAIELINYGVMFLQGDAEGMKRQRENLGKFDARIREQIREMVNTLSFGTLAKERGSFGSLFGSDATKAMGYASGGEVTRAGEVVGGVIGRTIKKEKVSRVVDVPTSPLVPGVDADGLSQYKGDPTLKNIDAFFPNPRDPKYVNSNQLISRSYDIVSSVPFLSPLLETSIKILMGDAPSSGDYNAIGVSLNNFINNILDKTAAPGKKTVVSDEIGSIDISNWARKAAEESISNTASSIIDNLSYQFSLRIGGREDQPKGGAGGESEGIQDVSISSGEMDLFTRMVYAEAGGEGKTGMALVARAILNRAGLIQSGKVGAGTFNAKSGSITDVINGRGQFSPITDGRINQKLSDSQISQAKDAIVLAQNPAQLMLVLKGEGLDDISIKKLVASTGFRNYDAGAGQDASQKVNEVKFKRHTFNTAGNAGLAVPQSIAISKEESSANMIDNISSGTGGTYGKNSVGTRIAGDLGRYMYKALRSGPDFSQVSEHPDFGGSFKRSYRSWHNVDRAIDIGGYWPKDQVKILAKVKEFNTKNNVKPVELLYGKPGTPESGSHGDHVHVAYKEGGFVDKTDYALTHKNEYVVDADSVSSFGKEFYDIINQTETATQRKNAANRLMQILSQYTEDGYVESEEDYTYYVPEKGSVTVMPPQIIMTGGMSGGSRGSESEDPSKDILYV